MNDLNQLQKNLDYFVKLNDHLKCIINQNRIKMDEIYEDLNKVCLKESICINCLKSKKLEYDSICDECHEMNGLESYLDYKFW